MSCACGTISCYICREKVDRSVGYKHFCQVQSCDHKACGRCPLFNNSVEDDRLAMREAGIKAMQENEVGLLRASKEGGAEAKGVDIDDLLEAKPDNAEAMRRAAVMAQQNAHLGVGAMARVAYAEIGRDDRRDRQWGGAREGPSKRWRPQRSAGAPRTARLRQTEISHRKAFRRRARGGAR